MCSARNGPFLRCSSNRSGVHRINRQFLCLSIPPHRQNILYLLCSWGQCRARCCCSRHSPTIHTHSGHTTHYMYTSPADRQRRRLERARALRSHGQPPKYRINLLLFSATKQILGIQFTGECIWFVCVSCV